MPRWPAGRNWCRGRRSSGSGLNRSAVATPSWVSPRAGPSATRSNHRRSSRESLRCTVPTKVPLDTWARAVRSGSPIPRTAWPSASSATTWRTRRCRSWAPAWSTCCTRAWPKGAPVYAADKAAEDPDGAALIFEPSGRTVRWSEYEQTANQVAHLIRESGLEKHDHIALFMENIPEVLLTEAGAERTGVYYTPVNSYLSAEEVAYIVNDSKARVVLTSVAKADVAAQLPALCPHVERWIMV